MKLQVKRVLAMLMLAVLAVMMTGCFNNTDKTGVVDVQKVMQDSPKVKQFQDQLNESGKQLTEKLEQEKANLSAEDFQKRQQDTYAEFVKQKQDLEGQVDTLMNQALTDVAKEKGLSVVLYKNNVAQGGVDITDDVIKKLQ
ncbi:OmpH family outer membrane protein [Anaerosinus massiliensis]|uniref:OmpH family outer membrane protein n=1 Tax=Massilibacillus massiliensis TaxID=1806837 RepID=UPI0018FE0DEA|nr:OmpH family outer membrane protein [Massilibacillus massiliensis]